MSTGRLRSTRRLRSRSVPCSGYCEVASISGSHTLTTFSTRSPSRTGNDHDVQPRGWPAVTCAVSAIGPTRIAARAWGRYRKFVASSIRAARLPFRQPGYRFVRADGRYRMRLVVGSAPDLQGSFETPGVDGSVRARELARRGGRMALELDADACAGPPSRQNDSGGSRRKTSARRSPTRPPWHRTKPTQSGPETMRFLANAGVSPKTVDFLKQLGHEAVHVRTLGTGRPFSPAVQIPHRDPEE